MSDLSNRLAMRERMLHEENVRLNHDHALLLKRAPEAWEQFKVAFFDECHEIDRQTNLTHFQCDEPDPRSFNILRKRNYVPAIAVQSFQFDASVPCIVWQDLLNKKLGKVIEIALDQFNLFFVQDGKPVILSRFVEDCLQKSLL